MAPVELGDRAQIDRSVLADRRMWAAARLDAHDAVFGKRLQPGEDQCILLGIDVVGDDGDRPALAHRLAELLRERRLA